MRCVRLFSRERRLRREGREKEDAEKWPAAAF